MKKISIVILLVLISLTAFSQEKGVCLWFSTTKGIGEVQVNNGFDYKYFVNYKALPIIDGRFATPGAGDSVIFYADENLRIEKIIEIKQ